MRLRLWRSDVQMAQAVRASSHEHAHRSRLFLELENEGIVGFGEVSPQPFAVNGDPGIEEVLEELLTHGLVQFVQVVAREVSIPSWTRVARFAGSRRASAFAFALLEMAVLDYELRATSRTVQDLWPAVIEPSSQQTVSLLSDDPWVVAPDARRVRVKTAPGYVDSGRLERLGGLRIPVILDFNCSAETVGDVVAQVNLIRERCELYAVEQPFAPGNLVDHALLAREVSERVSLDEGIRTTRDVDQAVQYDAATMICVKPARVGGLANARTIVQRAQSKGVEAYLGGFFESPFARTVHGALAANCVPSPSDVGVVDRADQWQGRETRRLEGGFGLAPSEPLLASATLLSIIY